MEISVPAVEALRAYLTLDADRMNQLAGGCGADYEVLSGAAFYLLIRRSVARHGVAADLYAAPATGWRRTCTPAAGPAGA